MQTPKLKETTQQVIIVRGQEQADGSKSNIKHDFIRQNNALLADDFLLASDIIKALYAERAAEVRAQIEEANTNPKPLASMFSPIFADLDDVIEEQTVNDKGVRVLPEYALEAVTSELRDSVIEFLRADKSLAHKRLNEVFFDSHDKSHRFVLNLERQMMIKPEHNERPIMVSIKPVDGEGVGLINPSRLGSLELASDITNMVKFYASKMVNHIGKTEGKRDVQVSDDEVAFQLDAFADDIYEFAKDAKSTTLSVNMNILNTLNEQVTVCIDICRTREWRNPV